MVTISQKGIFESNLKYALTAFHSPLNEPRNLKQALQHPLLVDAMSTELQAFQNIVHRI